MDVEITYTNGEKELRHVRCYMRDKNRVMWFLTDNGWKHSFCVRSVTERKIK